MERRANSFRDKILVLVIALVAGTGGTIAYRQISPPAPDRFTGTQAREMEQRATVRIEKHEVRIKALELAQQRLLSVTDGIAAGVHRIEVEIARLPPDEWRERIRRLERLQSKHHSAHEEPKD